MNPPTENHNKKHNLTNVTIAVLTGQVGVLTLVIILAAVFGGLALDNALGTKPWATVGLLVLSLPVSLFLMIFLARKAVKRLKTSETTKLQEEDAVGEDS
jgi:membrane protein implicated in regulation of membrane protease activity